MPPFTYGAIRSTTFRPVSKISMLGERSWNLGGSRWIDQRSTSSPAGGLLSTGSPITFQMPAQRRVADRHGDRGAGVDHVDSAREAVRRVHRDRAHAVVAQVLLHLGDQRPGGAAVGARHLDREGVVDLGQLAGEDGVDHDALDLDDLADVLLRVLGHVAPRALRVSASGKQQARTAPPDGLQSTEALSQAGPVALCGQRALLRRRPQAEHVVRRHVDLP